MSPNENVRPVWGHLEYTWRLEKLWELRALASIEALDEDGGDVVWSSSFGDTDHGFWRLKLYPYGDSSPGGKGHVSVFLSLDTKRTENPRAYAIFGCYVLDDKGEKMPEFGRSFTRQRFGDQSCSWGWSQFIKVEGQSLSKILVDEALTLKCQIDVFLGMRSNCSVDLPPEKSVGTELAEYSEEPSQLDVRLVWTPPAVKASTSVGDTSATAPTHFEINSHLLSARSPKFRGMLRDLAHNAPTTNVKSSPGGGFQTAATTAVAVAVQHMSPTQSYTSFGGPSHETDMASVAAGRLPQGGVLYQGAMGPVAAAPNAYHSPHPNSNLAAVQPPSRPQSEERAAAALGRQLPPSQMQYQNRFDHSNPAVLNLEGITLEAATEMVTFMKSDKCSLIEANAASLDSLLDLLTAAKHYEVSSLMWKIVKMILGRMTNEQDSVAILEKALALGIEPLITEARRFLHTCSAPPSKKELLAGSEGVGEWKRTSAAG